jgi:hypothetical protein
MVKTEWVEIVRVDLTDGAYDPRRVHTSKSGRKYVNYRGRKLYLRKSLPKFPAYFAVTAEG